MAHKWLERRVKWRSTRNDAARCSRSQLGRSRASAHAHASIANKGTSPHSRLIC